MIAKDVADLHGASNNLNKQTALNEKGEVDQRPRRHAEPARHPHRLAARRYRFRRRRRSHLRQLDQERRRRRDGRPLTTAPASNESAPAKSWNSSHPSRGPGGGCSQADLKSTGGDGLFYCFAGQ